jgi:hypothetical protein
VERVDRIVGDWRSAALSGGDSKANGYVIYHPLFMKGAVVDGGDTYEAVSCSSFVKTIFL